jgi:hypothetical protein
MSASSTFDVKAYRALVLAAYTTSGPVLLTPGGLLAMAEEADSEYKALLKEFPPGTVNDRRNVMREVSESAVCCAGWLEKQPCTSMLFVGPFGPQLPHRGSKVVIRKGSRVFGTNLSMDGVLSVRDQAITVHSSDRGFVDSSGITRSGPEYGFRQAKVTWAGSGGYWRWTEANNVRLMVPVAEPG